MPIKRRVGPQRRPDLLPEYWYLLRDESIPSGLNPILRFEFYHRAPELWREHQAQVVREWVARAPGTRPNLWWVHDAPEKSRERMGGKGTASHDGLNCAPEFSYGVPSRWVVSRLIDYYGQRDGKPYARAEHFDRSDPPTFESQAQYLKRHALLLPDEAGGLCAADFEPEVLPARYWPKP